MASKVDIVSAVLRSLGEVGIAALTEDNENARKVLAVYDIHLRSMLRAHPWSFNKKETTLSQLIDEPILDDFTYIYQLPPDFIRLNKTSVEPTYSHKIKGSKLYSNADKVIIEYGYYLDDPSQYDDAFVEAFIAKLAAELCYSITRNENMVKVKWSEFTSKFSIAKNLNAMEVTPDEGQNDSWLQARL